MGYRALPGCLARPGSDLLGPLWPTSILSKWGVPFSLAIPTTPLPRWAASVYHQAPPRKAGQVDVVCETIPLHYHYLPNWLRNFRNEKTHSSQQKENPCLIWLYWDLTLSLKYYATSFPILIKISYFAHFHNRLWYNLNFWKINYRHIDIYKLIRFSYATKDILKQILISMDILN